MDQQHSIEEPSGRSPALGGGGALRCILGGVLMGLANLVPGISGGTMLLAVGIYRFMIEAIADLASFRSPVRSGVVLALVILPALLAIVGLSGVAGRFVLESRWIAYSLFIGLTLGGIPVLVRSIGGITPIGWLGCLLGLVVMAFLAMSEGDASTGHGSSGSLMLVVAGLCAGAAMLLPGLSGSYVLLVLGQYVVVLSSIDEARVAVTARAWPELFTAMGTIVPVAIGVVLGIAIVGVVVRWCLSHLRQLTLGVLLGLLVGALFGLWPFKEAVPPEIGSNVRGFEIVSLEQAESIKPKYWPTVGFTPTASQVAGACVWILLGAALSGAIGCLGRDEENDGSSSPAGV